MRWAIGLLVALNLTVFLYFGVLNPSRQQAGTKLPEPEKADMAFRLLLVKFKL